MKYNFDNTPDRCETDSFKWDKYKGRDVLPMWVADMDFPSPPAILDALRRRIDHGVLGYALPGNELNNIVVKRTFEKYNWKIQPEWIEWLPGLVPALHAACLGYCNANENVVTFTPVYPPFLSAPILSHRQLQKIAMKQVDGRFQFDVDSFKNAIMPETKLLLFCSPHNPVGRCFDRRELLEIADVCLDNDIVICSDEVHCDLILDDRKHIALAVLGDEIAQHTITLMSPSKTFNVAGLNLAYAIIPNAGLRRAFRQARLGVIPNANLLGYTSCLAAFRDCDDWHCQLLEYLTANRDLLEVFVNEKLEGVSVNHIEATYLAWLDVRQLKLENPVAFFEAAGVGLSDGKDFGVDGFLRLNFGCSRVLLSDGLNRIKKALMNQ